MHIQLSKPYQFKITIGDIIPAHIKLFAVNERQQSCTQAFLGQSSNDHSSWNNNKNELQFRM